MAGDGPDFEHLVGPYGEERVRGWAARLRHFRIVRAEPSPFSVETDSLQAALRGELPPRIDVALVDDPDSDLVEIVPAGTTTRIVIRGAARRRPVLTDTEVALAERIEPLLDETGVDLIDPPVAGRGCVWPGAYPDLWRIA